MHCTRYGEDRPLHRDQGWLKDPVPIEFRPVTVGASNIDIGVEKTWPIELVVYAPISGDMPSSSREDVNMPMKTPNTTEDCNCFAI
jgi:hypothetical protein